MIKNNSILDSSGAGIKAGGTGAVIDNTIIDATNGIYVAQSTGRGVEISGNTIDGRFAHGVTIAAGGTGALTGNLVRLVTGTGPAPAAVMAARAAKVSLHNNLLEVLPYDAFCLLLASPPNSSWFTANGNAYTATGPRTISIVGYRPQTVQEWRQRFGQDITGSFRQAGG